MSKPKPRVKLWLQRLLSYRKSPAKVLWGLERLWASLHGTDPLDQSHGCWLTSNITGYTLFTVVDQDADFEHRMPCEFKFFSQNIAVTSLLLQSIPHILHTSAPPLEWISGYPDSWDLSRTLPDILPGFIYSSTHSFHNCNVKILRAHPSSQGWWLVLLFSAHGRQT